MQAELRATEAMQKMQIQASTRRARPIVGSKYGCVELAPLLPSRPTVDYTRSAPGDAPIADPPRECGLSSPTSSPVQGNACSAGDSAAYERLGGSLDDVVIISALRTPICKAKRGGLKDTPADDLLSAVLKATLQQTGIEPAVSVCRSCWQSTGGQMKLTKLAGSVMRWTLRMMACFDALLACSTRVNSRHTNDISLACCMPAALPRRQGPGQDGPP